MLPINHLKRTLDRCCGQWEFVASDHVPDNRRLTRWSATVRFLNTGIVYDVVWQSDRTPQWDSSFVTSLVSSKDDLFIANRLNGHTRDDAGNVSGGYQFFVDPPMEMTIEAGDEWQFCEDSNNWKPWLPKYLGMTLCDYWKLHKVKQPEKFQIRRRIHDPLYETPDKVML